MNLDSLDDLQLAFTIFELFLLVINTSIFLFLFRQLVLQYGKHLRFAKENPGEKYDDSAEASLEFLCLVTLLALSVTAVSSYVIFTSGG